ncbi:MAG: type VI secretion system tip protein VgrG [Bacteroidetes bacterium]|nr:MAG: type VI secretion system tip protein VgrG [Bacteroidota bacterium]
MTIGDFLSTTLKNNDLTTFKIFVDGNLISEQFPLMQFTTNHEINKIPKATIVFHDGDAAQEDFLKSNSSDFEKGKRIKILAGYHMDEHLLFDGIITGQRISGKATSCTYIHVECQHEVYQLNNRNENRKFKAQSEDSLFSAILKNYPDIKLNTKVNKDFKKEIVQSNVRDWDFLVSRAERACAFLFFNEKGKLTIQTPQMDGPKVASLKFGEDVFDFDLNSDARNQFSEVQVSAWSGSDQSLITASTKDKIGLKIGKGSKRESDKVVGNKIFTITHSGDLSKEELQCYSDAQMLKIKLSKIKGSLKCHGRADIKVGNIIGLSGFGEKFSGEQFFVSGVAHILEKGNWKTHFQIGLSEKWHHEQYNIQPTPSSGFSPGINGLQIGKVLKIIDDPKSEHRIQINLPATESTQNKGIWARMATLDAGNERGTFFRPEKGDEVIVGFINDDPNQAIILGHLHSKKNKPPVTAEETNAQKGFISRSELKITFDDEKKQILIQTPAGNQVLLDEENKSLFIEDQHQNKITLEKNGIFLESQKNIELNAPKGKISLAAKDINIEANSNLNAKAGMNASFEGKTQATLKGQMVMIN